MGSAIEGFMSSGRTVGGGPENTSKNEEKSQTWQSEQSEKAQRYKTSRLSFEDSRGNVYRGQWVSEMQVRAGEAEKAT